MPGSWFGEVEDRFTERGDQEEGWVCREIWSAGLGSAGLEMPRNRGVKRSRGLSYEPRSQGAACTVNVNLAVFL
jgi:hypothetical protein